MHAEAEKREAFTTIPSILSKPHGPQEGDLRYDEVHAEAEKREASTTIPSIPSKPFNGCAKRGVIWWQIPYRAYRESLYKYMNEQEICSS